MKKCSVFACPNRGARWYPWDLTMKAWLCESCIRQAQRAVEREEEKQKEYQLAK